MNRRGGIEEARLRQLLREAPLPAAAEAERRGLALVETAFAQRRPERRSPLPRLALALALVTLLAALLLSPAGAAVRDWVGDVFEAGVPDAESGLSRIPGGGRLLVQSAQGPWVVQPDGARRLLGEYDEAGWSPRGLFVATAAGRTLSAVEPDGTPHWSLPAPGRVGDQRWSPSGFQIAYRAGRQLRVVAGDGTEDRLLDGATAPVAPAWAPSGPALLAYVDHDGQLRILNTDSGEPVGAAAGLPRVAALEWSAAGLLEASRQRLRVRPVGLIKSLASLDLGRPREMPLPPGALVEEAAFAPGGQRIAALLRLRGAAEPRSEVVLIDPRDGSSRRLFAVTGRLAGLAWSPDGGRLLTSWPQADQWLFVPAQPRRGSRPGIDRIRAVGDVAAQFAPGAHLSAPFPRVEGWCCH